MEKNDKQVQHKVFVNPVLEVLSKSSPIGTLFTYGSIIFAAMYANYRWEQVTNLWSVLALYVGGILSWTLMEYLLHRFVFHYLNNASWVKRFHYVVHGHHHQYPKDEDRLFMPPAAGLVITVILLGLFYLAMGAYAFPFFGGVINGYLLYASIHYSVHRFKPPRGLKWLWKHHSLHHFKYPDKAYGVSSPIWDYVFGTLPPKKKKTEERQIVSGKQPS